ncbi:uncharacterized protein LOC114747427 isoform X1 [Neltuma alba]|uniref:uncharacterized protein LOC114747427 isoform X1 n=2 Tax=Neltuma alba TaxID=207710 RepID=UPI0010A57AE2|nr:uncharacterized protein LOC114747427 isoform X1 [Prosopis alba]XP_028791595.1 uncharacterized protein LOC114747427 isoform X1 [Prosopis alba]XP_028791603.1 uncharacterized protein LOC114747427 isoform X1 [Prosopis alba]XP_028791612.1 uncharacterized protein LOC114747427 isoform X1 [Prosopis alba]
MHELPFQVGQLAETRSLQPGYRGAWFRCKIQKIREKNGELSYRMEYVDYPDQGLEWVKVYQKPRTKKCLKLMVRPCYPTMYLEREKPDMRTISEEIVIVDNTWMVGDLVDFCADGCYWSGRVAKTLEDGKFQIDLFPPPVGEGSSYEAFYKDIRPSLDWSPKKGWTVPKAKVLNGGKQRLCAQLIKPEHSDGKAAVQTSVSTSSQCSSSHSSPITVPFLDAPEGRITVNNAARTGMDIEAGDPSTRETNYSDNAPSTYIRAESAENMPKKEINDGLFNEQPPKKLRKDKSICLDSMFLHSIEGAILDLEELVNRVKWIKGLLEFGMPSSCTGQSFWEFRQHIA